MQVTHWYHLQYINPTPMFVSVCMHGSLVYPRGLKTHSTIPSVNAADSSVCVVVCLLFVCVCARVCARVCMCVRQLPPFLKCYFVFILGSVNKHHITIPELCAPQKYSTVRQRWSIMERNYNSKRAPISMKWKKGYYKHCWLRVTWKQFFSHDHKLQSTHDEQTALTMQDSPDSLIFTCMFDWVLRDHIGIYNLQFQVFHLLISSKTNEQQCINCTSTHQSSH